MVKSVKKERRVSPRIAQKLPMRIAVGDYDFSTTTQNVSYSGAYCRLTKYVPPFTKIAVKMTLPIIVRGKKQKFTVDCKGVIVRTEDEATGGFNIAVFFNEINDSQRKKIAKYIGQFLPKATSRI